MEPTLAETAIVKPGEIAADDGVAPPQVEAVDHPILHCPALHYLDEERSWSFHPQQTRWIQAEACTRRRDSAQLSQNSHGAAALRFVGNDLRDRLIMQRQRIGHQSRGNQGLPCHAPQEAALAP